MTQDTDIIEYLTMAVERGASDLHLCVGSQVMIGGVCGVRDDIIPFGLVNGFEFSESDRKRIRNHLRVRLINRLPRSGQTAVDLTR